MSTPIVAYQLSLLGDAPKPGRAWRRGFWQMYWSGIGLPLEAASKLLALAERARDAESLALRQPTTTNHIATDNACEEMERACSPELIIALITALELGMAGRDYELATHDRWHDWRLDHPDDLSRIITRLGWKDLATSGREDAALPANDGYTGEPCPVCGRIRVYLRRDGQTECEKCESVFPAPMPQRDVGS